MSTSTTLPRNRGIVARVTSRPSRSGKRSGTARWCRRVVISVGGLRCGRAGAPHRHPRRLGPEPGVEDAPQRVAVPGARSAGRRTSRRSARARSCRPRTRPAEVAVVAGVRDDRPLESRGPVAELEDARARPQILKNVASQRPSSAAGAGVTGQRPRAARNGMVRGPRLPDVVVLPDQRIAREPRRESWRHSRPSRASRCRPDAHRRERLAHGAVAEPPAPAPSGRSSSSANGSGPPARSSTARHGPPGRRAVASEQRAASRTGPQALQSHHRRPIADRAGASSPPPAYRSPASTGAGIVLPRHGAGQGYAEL